MRKIEAEMVQALRARRDWHKDNTRVEEWRGVWRVLLHGHCIYKCGPNGERPLFTLAGWNTATTRSRLRALGVAVSTKGGRAMLRDQIITDDNWYDV